MGTTPNTANPDKVSYTCNVSRSQDKEGKGVDTRSVTFHFDFAGVSRSALMSEAIRNIIVRLQGQMRSATKRKENPLTWDKAVAQFNGGTLNVAEILSKSRQKITPEVKRQRLAKEAIDQGPEAVDALIALLMASKKAKGK